MWPMQTIRCFIPHVSDIIVDEEVEEEVEGSSKWTDRALMLQSGLLTAVEVELRLPYHLEESVPIQTLNLL